MNRISMVTGWTCALLMIAGCASNPKPGSVSFDYLKQGVKINLSATSDLNTYNRQPHTLVVVAYQLSEPNVYHQMLEDPDGFSKLLEGESFDSSVLSRRKIVLQPSEVKEVYMDRAAGVRYVGIVAGYFSDDVVSLSRLVSVEVRDRDPYFWRWSDNDPADTIVDLVLGRDRVNQVKLNNKQI